MGRFFVCLTLVGVLFGLLLCNSGCSPVEIAANVADLALSTGTTAVEARVNMDRVGNTSQPMDVVWDASLMAAKKLKIVVDDKKFGENEATISGHYGRLDYIRIYLFKQSPVSTKIGIQARTALLPMTKNGYDYSFARTIMDTISQCIPEAAAKTREEDKTYTFIEKIPESAEAGEPVDITRYVSDRIGQTYNYAGMWEANGKSGRVDMEEKFQGYRILNGKRVEIIHVTYKYYPSGKSKSNLLFYVLDDTGYYEYAEQKSDMPEPKILENPVYEFKTPCFEGKTWQGNQDTFLLVRKIKVPALFTIEKVDDVVTVPAGTFERCIRIRAYSHVKNSKGTVIKFEAFYWYAPDVGYIKSIYKEECSNPALGKGGKYMVDLKSYTLPKSK